MTAVAGTPRDQVLAAIDEIGVEYLVYMVCSTARPILDRGLVEAHRLAADGPVFLHVRRRPRQLQRRTSSRTRRC